ncbi:hypothetical protein BB559_000165 [Furculomyces boomerangus]|uniref:DNA polymerase alpha subunit B n=1 Tax=Furculomyces boomerangus TaxID=61424 RepID=A0A2T9Z624_9FUNG|nr:hypothetical protein BB559_000165 [Furculomyces boomerangus]
MVLDITEIKKQFLPTKISDSVSQNVWDLVTTYDISLDSVVESWQVLLFSHYSSDQDLDEEKFMILKERIVSNWQTKHAGHTQPPKKVQSMYNKQNISNLTDKNQILQVLNQQSKIPDPKDKICMGMVPGTWFGQIGSKGKGSTKAPFRYMIESIGDRIDHIERHTDMISMFCKADFGITTLANPRYMHQENVFVVGRIVDTPMESENGGVKRLDPQSVELLTTKRLGSGGSVPLDISSLGSFSLFPGQVVLVEGKNLQNAFKVEQIKQLPIPPKLDFEFIKNIGHVTNDFQIIVASGPLTTSDGFEYLPLRDIAQVITNEKPHLAIIMGPFVSELQVRNTPNLELTPEQIFLQQVSPILNGITTSCPDTKLVLVPSTDDICFPYACYPQPEISKAMVTALGIPQSAILLPNPAQIIVNGCVICLNNADTLLSMSSSEINHGLDMNRMERLVLHMIEQRSLFPLDPPSQNVPVSYTTCLNESKKIDLENGYINLLDVKHMDDGNEKDGGEYYSPLSIPFCPDIFINASQTKPFATDFKDAITTTFVNPGKLATGIRGGTFAKLNVFGDNLLIYNKFPLMIKLSSFCFDGYMIIKNNRFHVKFIKHVDFVNLEIQSESKTITNKELIETLETTTTEYYCLEEIHAFLDGTIKSEKQSSLEGLVWLEFAYTSTIEELEILGKEKVIGFDPDSFTLQILYRKAQNVVIESKVEIKTLEIHSGWLTKYYKEFEEICRDNQQVWNVLDAIDSYCYVVYPQINVLVGDSQNTENCSFVTKDMKEFKRRVAVGDLITIELEVDSKDPRGIPQSIAVLGPRTVSKEIQDNISKSSGLWDKKKEFVENLEILVGKSLKKIGSEEISTIVCGICFAYKNEIGNEPDIICGNNKCKKPLHKTCLKKASLTWLQTSSSRGNYRVLFGKCPYCQHETSIVT